MTATLLHEILVIHSKKTTYSDDIINAALPTRVLSRGAQVRQVYTVQTQTVSPILVCRVTPLQSARREYRYSASNSFHLQKHSIYALPFLQ